MSTNRIPLLAHFSLAGAAICWGLMSPLGKDAMQHGIDGITLVSLRVMGGAILFWISSLFAPRESISRKHIALLCLAAVFGLVGNQCCFTIGLSLTSPVNAGIVTTTMPISALLLSAIILKEPITLRKALGVALGCCGAVLLVMSSVRAASGSASVSGLSMGDMRGDLLCFAAQISYTIYLTVFGWLAKRYSIFTVNKWMFLSATCIIWPFTAQHVWQTPWSSLYGHPRRNRIRRSRGNIPSLYPHDSRTTSAATHCREHVQLCSTHRCRHCQHRSWTRCLHTHSRSGCRAHLLRSSTRHTLQVEKRYATKPNEERRKYYV